MTDSVNIPEGLFLDEDDISGMEGDFLIRAFFDTLRMIHNMFINVQVDGEIKSVHGLEGYTRQLLSDFVRILFLANNALLGKCHSGDVHIKYVLPNYLH